ncbi:MAG: SDR family NAD(P)-dependent oxidoreductase [Waterburya sp.]
MDFESDDLEITLKVLQQISENPTLINSHHRFKSLIAKIYKQGKKNKKQVQKQEKQQLDRALKLQTGMVKKQSDSASIDPTNHHKFSLLASTQDNQIIGNLQNCKNCYICKQAYTKLHFFYHLLCPVCADFNYQKRHQSTNLQGRVALITGGRIKIGYQTALKMLRDGAKVIVTTRFPGDAAHRFSQETDFEQWRDHLYIYALDLRNITTVETFVKHLLNTESALDIIINNAAQTIKRPLAFYQHLLNKEKDIYNALSEHCTNLPVSNNNKPVLLEALPQYQKFLQSSSKLRRYTAEYLEPDNIYFPANKFDDDGQQLDTRPINSWKLKLDEVGVREMLEVQLVNVTAPFILNSQLKPLLMKSPFLQRFIINVSAMEGQFNRHNKTIFHPHTNMAKAALNMMTRTVAADYAEDNINMNSVDTGWITDENPYTQKTYQQEKRGFYPPLDIIDGMARIYDPIVRGINSNEIIYGQFLKDYQSYPW